MTWRLHHEDLCPRLELELRTLLLPHAVEDPGRLFELALGDHAEVTQATDLTGVMLVRALLRLRVHASTPAGLAWEASIIVDGTKHSAMRAKPGRERLVTDLAANVSKLSGLHTIGVRLELVVV